MNANLITYSSIAKLWCFCTMLLLQHFSFSVMLCNWEWCNANHLFKLCLKEINPLQMQKRRFCNHLATCKTSSWRGRSVDRGVKSCCVVMWFSKSAPAGLLYSCFRAWAVGFTLSRKLCMRRLKGRWERERERERLKGRGWSESVCCRRRMKRRTFAFANFLCSVMFGALRVLFLKAL